MTRVIQWATGITAMHAINAIPAVVAAEPGLYDVSTIAPFVANWTNREGNCHG